MGGDINKILGHACVWLHVRLLPVEKTAAEDQYPRAPVARTTRLFTRRKYLVGQQEKQIACPETELALAQRDQIEEDQWEFSDGHQFSDGQNRETLE